MFFQSYPTVVIMKTKQQIVAAVAIVAEKYNAQVDWGMEDGYTWLTLIGGSINPKIFDEVTTQVSQATGVDCYFNKCWIDSIEIVVNAKLNYNIDNQGNYQKVEDNEVPLQYPDNKIEQYGTLFK
jgi:hypothetical protein